MTGAEVAALITAGGALLSGAAALVTALRGAKTAEAAETAAKATLQSVQEVKVALLTAVQVANNQSFTFNFAEARALPPALPAAQDVAASRTEGEVLPSERATPWTVRDEPAKAPAPSGPGKAPSEGKEKT